MVQDKYEKVRNHDQIARVEDRFTGTAFNFKLGMASTGLGSDRDALLIAADQDPRKLYELAASIDAFVDEIIRMAGG